MPRAPHQTSVRLSDSARRGFDRLAVRHRVTLTALLEALGQRLDEDPSLMSEETIRLAAQVDFERRNRR